jgi:hypothetical protein
MPDRQIDYRHRKPDGILPKTPRERTRLGLLADAATREAAALMPWIVWALVFGALIALAGALGGCAPTDEPAPALGRACECEPDDDNLPPELRS